MSKKRRRRNSWQVINVNTAAVAGVSLLVLVVLIIIIVNICIGAFGKKTSAKDNEQEEVSSSEVASSDVAAAQFVQYGGYNVPLYEDIPLNEYDTEQFKVEENGRITYPNASPGIDVSEYQGEIDWNAVKNDGIEWASLRIGRRGYTEGGLFPDAQFALNFKNAQAVGMPIGVYYFSQSITVEEAHEEAQYVLDTLNGAKLDGPVVYDWEEIVEDEARTDNVSVETLCAMANEFCSVIRAAGYKTEVYFNTYTGYARYNVSKLNADALWLASYADTPNFYYIFERWQYTHQGKVAGINGGVDLNLRFD